MVTEDEKKIIGVACLVGILGGVVAGLISTLLIWDTPLVSLGIGLIVFIVTFFFLVILALKLKVSAAFSGDNPFSHAYQ